MGPLEDPYEVGLGFAVRLAKDFVGCEALRERKEAPRDRRLLSVKLDDSAPMLWHAESVLSGDERGVRPHAGQCGGARVGARRGVAGRACDSRDPQPEGAGDDLVEAVLPTHPRISRDHQPPGLQVIGRGSAT